MAVEVLGVGGVDFDDARASWQNFSEPVLSRRPPVREPKRSFIRKSEKQKMEMKKENKYDTTRTVRNLPK